MMRRVLAGLDILVRRFIADQGFLLASALSFSFLLCLAPLALLLVAGMGFLLQSGDIAAYVLEMASSLVPGYSEEVSAALAVLIRERTVSGVVGGFGLAIFTIQLFSLTRTVMAITFRTEQRRGVIHGFAFDLFALAVSGLLAAILCGALLVAFAVGGLAMRIAPSNMLPHVRGGRLIALPLVYITLTELLFFVYRTFPYTAIGTRAAVVAAVAVAAMWELARLAFGTYLSSYGVYGQLYGSFGVLVATLVWIYYSAVIFVLGAELAAMLSSRDQASAEAASARERTPPPSISRLVLAPALVATLALLALAWQSNAPTRIHFLVWSSGDVPLAGVVLAAALLGLLIGAGLLWAERARLRAELRAAHSSCGPDRIPGEPPRR